MCSLVWLSSSCCVCRTHVVDVSHTTMTLEVQGRENKMRALLDLLEPYGEGEGLFERKAAMVVMESVGVGWAWRG